MLSLVEQVDAILQRYLLDDPELAERKIHLVQDPNGGLIIDVMANGISGRVKLKTRVFKR